MLIRFAVENFRSVSEEVDFNMIPYARLQKHRDHLLAPTGDFQLLKTAVVYGGNGAGKSTLIMALDYFIDAIESNVQYLPDYRFRLGKEWTEKPSRFELEFFYMGKFHSYHMLIADGGIIEEELNEIVPTGSSEGRVVFTRLESPASGTTIHLSPLLAETEEDQITIGVIEKLLDSNVSLLKFLKKQKMFPEIATVYDYFTEYIDVVFPDTTFQGLGLAAKMYLYPELKELINDVFSKLDTGAIRIELASSTFDAYFGIDDHSDKLMWQNILKKSELDALPLPPEYGDVVVSKSERGELAVHRLVVVHSCADGSEQLFELDEESDGTIRLLELMPIVVSLLDPGRTVFVDEIGRSIHPSLLKAFVQYLLSSDFKGQLVFTTHQTQLLDADIFRQDEIWFTEKTNAGNTKMYPLSDYKTRADLDIQRGYLNGRFGAVPFLGDLNQLQFGFDHASPE